MARLGIAGYMGSGKSTFAHVLSQKGYTVFDADSIAKKLMNTSQDIKEKLVTAFGHTVLSDNEIQFSVLGNICFSSETKLAALNEIVHPPLIEHLETIICNEHAGPCVLDAALIPLWSIAQWFDRLYWVHASREARLKRLSKKLAIPMPDLEKRMQQQEQLFQEPTGDTWTTLLNDGTVEEFQEKISTVCKTFDNYT